MSAILAVLIVLNGANDSLAVYSGSYAAPPAIVHLPIPDEVLLPSGQLLAFDEVTKLLFVGWARTVRIYQLPLTISSRPIRVLHLPGGVSAIAVEHHFYKHGLVEVATIGAGLHAFDESRGFAEIRAGSVYGISTDSMAFDSSGHLFVADQTHSDGRIRAIAPTTGRAYIAPISGFALGPKALTFDQHGNLWAEGYQDTDVRSGIAVYAPPFTAVSRFVPDEGAKGAPDWESLKLVFADEGLIKVRLFGDVRYSRDPYAESTASMYSCADPHGSCYPVDAAIDSTGNLVVAIGSLVSCTHGGSLKVYAPPFAANGRPIATITTGVACPMAIVAAP